VVLDHAHRRGDRRVLPELDPKDFSFNSARGWCPRCRGYGKVYPWMAKPGEEEEDEDAARLLHLGLAADEKAEGGEVCPDCRGERLNRISRAVKLHLRGRREPISLPALLACPPSQLLANLEALDLDLRGRLVTRDIVPQIRERLRFMDHVGLGYLSLDRPTKTLSGGEAQRIRLAAQLGTNLAGVLYVLDERASAFTRATTGGSSRRSSPCATRATRWSWSSTTTSS